MNAATQEEKLEFYEIMIQLHVNMEGLAADTEHCNAAHKRL